MMHWMERVFNLTFGCRHSRLSFPVTLRRPARFNVPVARQTGTYVVCLDCGREFPYDWEKMQIAGGNEASVRARKSVERAA